MNVEQPNDGGYAFEDLRIGQTASSTDVISEDLIRLFGEASGDHNPLHFDASYAAGTRFKRPIAHGLLTAALLTKVMGMQLPGPGSVYVGQTLNFRHPVYPGDQVTSTVTVASFDPERGFAMLAVRAEVDDKVVLDGEATVMPRRRQAA